MSHPFTLEYMMQGEEEYERICRGNKAAKDPHNTDGASSSMQPPQPLESDHSECQVNQEAPALPPPTSTKEPGKRPTIPSLIRTLFRFRLTAFANDAAMVGLDSLVKPAVSRAGKIARKILWIALLLFGVGFMSYQICDRIIYYLSWPTKTDYKIAFNESLRFPSVTLCSEIRGGRQASLIGFGPVATEIIAKMMPPIPDVDFKVDITAANSSTWTVNWQYAYEALTPTLENTVIQCEFLHRPCNMTADFKYLVNEFRSCYTFNPAATNYYTTQSGSTYGLRLLLWTNQSDALVTASPATGFRFFLHDPVEIPLMNAIGFRVSVGRSTAIQFTFRNISQLPHPYGDCRDEKGYTFMKCMAKCSDDYIFKFCKCVTSWPTPFPVCSMEQVLGCALTYTKQFTSSGASRECVCPLQCNQRSYPYSVSSTILSELYLNSTSMLPTFLDKKVNGSRLRREIAYVDVFFTSLEYIDIQTAPAYNVLKLFSDLGGALGLILGGTVLTVCEVFQLGFDIFSDFVVLVQFLRGYRN